MNKEILQKKAASVGNPYHNTSMHIVIYLMDNILNLCDSALVCVHCNNKYISTM